MNSKGFTLVELLIVIAIIGLITIIVMPSLIDIQQEQKNAKYTTYEKTIVEVAKLYTDQLKDDIGGEHGCFTIDHFDLLGTGLIDDLVDDKTAGCEYTIQYTLDQDGREEYVVQMRCLCADTDNADCINGYIYDNNVQFTKPCN